ncbi:hypothetical protein [Listeria booriae]|uniref:hypothetical protein n=1 Tax=Listeria booriae TaxID=1552123 RepID=UPI0016250471|nr:hypothetical protein [Listeria booriae]MBC1290484.1 hypothetical protein [Listeria booriae]
MRYSDINPAFDPLLTNITTANLHAMGVFAPETEIYVSRNNEARQGVMTDVGGLFECDFDFLFVGDVVNFYVKNGTGYDVFLAEQIRE